MNFMQQWLAKFWTPVCASGNSNDKCPEPVTHEIQRFDYKFFLCEKCFKTYMAMRKEQGIIEFPFKVKKV